jgi:hypothetical protein
VKRFIEGESRAQATLCPERLDDWMAGDDPVRSVDAFDDALDLVKPGLEGAEAEATAQPAYGSTAAPSPTCPAQRLSRS